MTVARRTLAEHLANAPLLSPVLFFGVIWMLDGDVARGATWFAIGILLAGLGWLLRHRLPLRVLLQLAVWGTLAVLVLRATPEVGWLVGIMAGWLGLIAGLVWMAAKAPRRAS